jgi:hypothetical protein
MSFFDDPMVRIVAVTWTGIVVAFGIMVWWMLRHG